jgi:hypothetical protein
MSWIGYAADLAATETSPSNDEHYRARCRLVSIAFSLYCSNLLVPSQVQRRQGLCGAKKYARTPDVAVNS